MNKGTPCWILRDFIYQLAIVDLDGLTLGGIGKNRRKMEPVYSWYVFACKCYIIYIYNATKEIHCVFVQFNVALTP